MAFRGKEWCPPDQAEVAAAITDRMSLTELTPDVLQQLVQSSNLNDSLLVAADLETRVEEATETLSGSLASANESYYKNVKAFAAAAGSKETVNIVIPVYNSVHLAAECIRSVLRNTFWPYIITVVDDASDQFTYETLEVLAKENPKQIRLLRNKKNRGFAATVNRGIKEFELDTKYTVLLNSDVLVTPYWLTKMVTALNSNPRNKIVNPVTNNTAVINVGMSPGFSYITMNAHLERTAARAYPEIMPTGFCFLVPNSLFQTIGYMDESYQNFGEETDFWMRTITYSDQKTYERWRAILADDTYVFHQRGASYESLGEEQHSNLRRLASGRFRQQWPSWQLWNKSFNVTKSIGPLRKNRSAKQLNEVLKATGHRGFSVCFLTHSVESCGGMHFIADIVNHINATGGDARVAVVCRDNKKPAEPVAELRSAPIIFQSAEDAIESFGDKVFKKGIIIAATAELSPLTAKIAEANTNLTPVLLAQSYEPDLIPDPEKAEEFAKNLTLIPNIISTSGWITKKLGVPVIDTINPGVDRNIFYPKSRDAGDERPTVMIALNPGYPFKGCERGMRVAAALQVLAKKNRKDIRIMAYGVPGIEGLNGVLCQGKLPRTRVAHLLATEVDVFLDPAHNHSYGMPALEAIACGAAVVGWDNKGIREYLPKGYGTVDPILNNDTPPEKVAETIFSLLLNDDLRTRVIEEQRKSALIQHHDRKQAVQKVVKHLSTLCGLPSLKIVVVTPHLRKHGGPTTLVTMANELANRGHKVKIATVYSDMNPSVVQYTDLPIILLNQSMDNFPKCDVVITNSDNPLNPQIATTNKATRKVMIKLSHNPRFKQLEEQGLQLKWDAVVTSTQWVADVCENPTPDWNYAPVKATRVGWFHYNFQRMRRNVKKKMFNKLGDAPIVISTLVHAHPSKGSAEAGAILNSIFQHYRNNVKFIGIGEVHPSEVKIAIPNMDYIFAPSRDELADIMAKTDIWLGCSHTEGLGRMALEAMTGAAACVLTDTNAEYVVPDFNAIVRPVGDLDGLANAVNDLIQDVDKRKEIALSGFATAKEMSDPTEFIDNIEKVIGDVF